MDSDYQAYYIIICSAKVNLLIVLAWCHTISLKRLQSSTFDVLKLNVNVYFLGNVLRYNCTFWTNFKFQSFLF